MSKRALNLLEPVKLIVWKVVFERVTIVKFRMDNGGGNGAGWLEVEIWTDTAKFTNVIVVLICIYGKKSKKIKISVFI